MSGNEKKPKRKRNNCPPVGNPWKKKKKKAFDQDWIDKFRKTLPWNKK